jgi:peptidoglycan/LPS O-acetylase OafA/YrhL
VNRLSINKQEHIDLLDGWRALSITLVLMGHLLPLGPKTWHINEGVAATGMVIFFTLSGFLITRFLIRDPNVTRFLVRRMMRIVPLAWLGILAAIVISAGTLSALFGNLLFYANIPPFYLVPAGGHFWSLCLEVQFYLMIALLVGIGGRRALFLLPVLCIAVTANRIANGEILSITTWYRADEILAGATIALIYEGRLGDRAKRFVSRLNPFLLLPCVLVSSNELAGPLCYARPYLSALMVGASLYNAPAWLHSISRLRIVKYVAQVSYALYVFHGLLMSTWLGSGEKIVKYTKRPLLLVATFGLAHFSTFHFERYWNHLGRKLTSRTRTSNTGVPSTVRARV